MIHASVVIPALGPEESLISYAAQLLSCGVPQVIVVDDGSGPEYGPVFRALEELSGCAVLRHPVNRGKGAALKTAIGWYLAQGGRFGLVTADCDGQHVAEDVLRVGQALGAHPQALVLGCRSFGRDTPRRSRIGNTLTSAALRGLYGIPLRDTQTGLRGLPQVMLPALAQLSGDRYEYELNMLLYARRTDTELVTVPIQTLYFDHNSGSRYRSVADSLPILALLSRGVLQYIGSSALSALVDVALYALLVKMLLLPLPLAARLFLAAGTARLLSSLVNYNCNRRLPYVQTARLYPTVVRYYILWTGQLLASFGAVWVLCAGLGMDELLAKLLIDGLLALASYQIQMRWVFRTHPPRKKAALARRETL